MSHFDLQDERNIAEADAEWESGIAFTPQSNTYKLLRALLSEADRIDGDLEDVYDSSHIDTASGDNLDKLGDLVNTSRQTGETDAAYRARVKAEFRAATIGTSFEEFIEFVAAVLATDPDNIDLFTNYGGRPAVVDVSTNTSVYDDAALTPTQLKDVFGSGVPAGHEVRVIEGGTFQLKADGDTDDPDKGLTSDVISSGGTLAEDLLS